MRINTGGEDGRQIKGARRREEIKARAHLSTSIRV